MPAIVVALEMSPLHRLLRRIFVPWWDPEQERKALEKSEEIRQRSIAARISAEKIRADYAAMSRKLDR